MTAWVYILRCADGSYYVGSHKGEEVVERVHQHNAGPDPQAYTYRRRPVELVWSDSFELNVDAFAAERRLKGWSRAKKEALIRGDFAELSRLARSKTPRLSAFAERLAAGRWRRRVTAKGPPSSFDKLRMRATERGYALGKPRRS
jgi:putative endonuclease